MTDGAERRSEAQTAAPARKKNPDHWGRPEAFLGEKFGLIRGIMMPGYTGKQGGGKAF
jgi:hypothetical protein